MSPAIVLYLRTDIDWRSVTEDTFYDLDRSNPTARALPTDTKRRLWRGIRLWNQTFGLTYFEYRDRLKEIAQRNWSRISGLSLVMRDARWYPALSGLDEFAVFPVDDDDWFHPEIADTLRRADLDSTDLFHWPDAVYRSSPEQGRFQECFLRLLRRSCDGFLATNGYAVTRRGLLRFAPAERRDVLLRHRFAGHAFQQPGFRRTPVGSFLSVTHKSLASTTNIEAVRCREDLLRNIPHLDHTISGLPAGLEWAAEPIAQVEQLNRELVRSAPCPRNHRPSIPSKDSAARRPLDRSVKTSAPQQRGRARLRQPTSRAEILNWLVRTMAYRSYLEIGCAQNRTFDAVIAPHKVGVDCRRGGTLRLTSDEFFRINQESFDLIFVDGLHLREQVFRDLEHSLACLSPGGCIVIHDCLPRHREQQERKPPGGAWTGDVWKAVVQFRRREDCDLVVLDADWGLGVLLARPNTAPLVSPSELVWDTFVAHRDQLLRVVDFDGLRAFLFGGEERSDGNG